MSKISKGIGAQRLTFDIMRVTFDDKDNGGK